MEISKTSVPEGALKRWETIGSQLERAHQRARASKPETAALNRGRSGKFLLDNLVTPTELFFVRNHGAVPRVDAATYRLTIDGRVRSKLQLSLADLRKRFAKQTISATITCSCLRRAELLGVNPLPAQVPWAAQAIGNAEWGGVPLRDVLYAAGLMDGALHAAFLGLDQVERDGANIRFGGSIPACKALCPEVFLAYEMNGEPLTPEHGFPLRVVVPGYIGARSVKWLAAITLGNRPSGNSFPAGTYRLAPKNVGSSRAVMLGLHSTNTVIMSPTNGEALISGEVLVQGFALTGRARWIERVELSADGGNTWTTGALTKQSSAWSWCFWQAAITLPRGRTTIIARAWDSAGQTQPASAADTLDPTGCINGPWHSIELIAE